jgi:hypothetical protein
MPGKGNAFVNAINKQKASMPILDHLGNGVYKAVVITKNSAGKKFIDPTGQGIVAAYIPALGDSPEEPRYFKHAQTGALFNVPDKQGTTILVFFADNGNLTEGFWFATSTDLVDIVCGGSSGKAKVDDTGLGEGVFCDVPTMKKPKDQYDVEKADEITSNSETNKIIADQGIYSDDLRGTTTTSPRRDAGYKTKDGKQASQHSKVMGVKSSGGSSFSIDDGSIGEDGKIHAEQIRIITSSGAGIILDGGNDFIYVVNSSGSGWVEIGASGEVMVYAEGSLNMRTEKDFNVRADKNINLEAKENVNIKSIEGNTKINSDKEIHLRSKGNTMLQTEATLNVNVGVNGYVTTGGKLHLNGPSAPESELILVDSMPDMQDLACTIVEDTIVSEMPTHEPFVRPHSKKLSTSKFAIDSASDNGLAKAGMPRSSSGNPHR